MPFMYYFVKCLFIRKAERVTEKLFHIIIYSLIIANSQDWTKASSQVVSLAFTEEQ